MKHALVGESEGMHQMSNINLRCLPFGFLVQEITRIYYRLLEITRDY